MQVGEPGQAMKPELQAIYGAVADGTNESLQSCRLCWPAIEMKKCNNPAQRDFDSRKTSAKIASATAGNKSRLLG